jgi:hypothetical protein
MRGLGGLDERRVVLIRLRGINPLGDRRSACVRISMAGLDASQTYRVGADDRLKALQRPFKKAPFRSHRPCMVAAIGPGWDRHFGYRMLAGESRDVATACSAASRTRKIGRRVLIGLADAHRTLQASPWLEPTSSEIGVRVFDVMHDVLAADRKLKPGECHR